MFNVRRLKNRLIFQKIRTHSSHSRVVYSVTVCSNEDNGFHCKIFASHKCLLHFLASTMKIIKVNSSTLLICEQFARWNAKSYYYLRPYDSKTISNIKFSSIITCIQRENSKKSIPKLFIVRSVIISL